MWKYESVLTFIYNIHNCKLDCEIYWVLSMISRANKKTFVQSVSRRSFVARMDCYCILHETLILVDNWRAQNVYIYNTVLRSTSGPEAARFSFRWRLRIGLGQGACAPLHLSRRYGPAVRNHVPSWIQRLIWSYSRVNQDSCDTGVNTYGTGEFWKIDT